MRDPERFGNAIGADPALPLVEAMNSEGMKMDVDCEGCGDRLSVDESAVARGPVEVTCDECGMVQLVTKSGHAIVPPRREHHEEPLNLAAIADGDGERLDDLAELASQSLAARTSRVDFSDLVEVPPSVRASIRRSLPPAGVAAEASAAPLEPASSAPADSPPVAHRGRLAVFIAGLAVVGAVAIGHMAVSTEAHGVERVVAMPLASATPSEPTPIVDAVGASKASIEPAVVAAPAQPELASVSNVQPVVEPVKESHSREKRLESKREDKAAAPSSTAASVAPAPNLMQAMQNAVKHGH